jgi:hypothetical protein
MIETPDASLAYTVADWRLEPGAEAEFVEAA